MGAVDIPADETLTSMSPNSRTQRLGASWQGNMRHSAEQSLDSLVAILKNDYKVLTIPLTQSVQRGRMECV